MLRLAVDGQNPAPVGRWFIPLLSHVTSLFTGFQSDLANYHLVQEFLSMHSVMLN